MRYLVLALPLLFAACSSPGPREGGSGAVMLNGAGATFPYPVYAKWFDEYHRQRPDAQINYQAIGSGGGIRQLQAGTVDFGASDMPVSDADLAKFPVPVLHFPTVLGAVVPMYHVAGAAQDLNFTPQALAGIMLGAIRKWNDPEIAKANPGVTLPAADIVVVHRSDGSGTTFIWTDYLSRVSPEWKSKVGSGTAVSWPVGLGGKGNEGVSGLVKQTPNSIGYVELIYAVQNRIPYGKVRNAAGNFIRADLKTVTAAAAGVQMPPDFRVSVVNAPGADAYPISSFTWLLIPSRIQNADKSRIMKDFLKWMSGPGQKLAEALTYAPLPGPVAEQVQQAVGRIP